MNKRFFLSSTFIVLITVGLLLQNRSIGLAGSKLWESLPATGQSGTIYLPIILTSYVGIHGRVTENGALATSVALELRFFDGVNWSTRANTFTDSNGVYQFKDMPGLQPGQIYYIRYRNDSFQNRLANWFTRDIETYTTGASINAGNFDLANIELIQPEPDAIVALPVTFLWSPRPYTPSDRYDFNLFDDSDDDPFFYTDPPLGYTDRYTLTSLPPGFQNGVPYGWSIGVFSPDGGYGMAYWYQGVTFSEGQSSPVDTRGPAEQLQPVHLKPLPLRNPEAVSDY